MKIMKNPPAPDNTLFPKGFTLVEVMISLTILSVVVISMAKILTISSNLANINEVRLQLISELTTSVNEMKLNIRFARLRMRATNELDPDFKISSIDNIQPVSSLFSFYCYRDKKYHRYYKRDNLLVVQMVPSVNGAGAQIPASWTNASEKVLSKNLHTLIFSKTEYANAGAGDLYPYVEMSATFAKERKFLGDEESMMVYVEKIKLENP